MSTNRVAVVEANLDAYLESAEAAPRLLVLSDCLAVLADTSLASRPVPATMCAFAAAAVYTTCDTVARGGGASSSTPSTTGEYSIKFYTVHIHYFVISKLTIHLLN